MQPVGGIAEGNAAGQVFGGVGGQSAGDPIFGCFEAVSVGPDNTKKLEPLAERWLRGDTALPGEFA